MNSKPIWQSKTLIGLVVALLGPWLAKKFGLTLDDAAQQVVVEHVIEGIGGALAFYGRLKADTGLRLTPSGKPLLALALGAGLLTGCATWEGFSPTTQAVLKAGAKLALSYGVQELGDRVKEVRPFQSQLNSLLDITFAAALSAEATGAALKAGVAQVVPLAQQPAVLAQFKESLAGAKTAAAAPGNASYNQRIAARL